jgi:hypothetical protein
MEAHIFLLACAMRMVIFGNMVMPSMLYRLRTGMLMPMHMRAMLLFDLSVIAGIWMPGQTGAIVLRIRTGNASQKQGSKTKKLFHIVILQMVTCPIRMVAVFTKRL